MMLTKANTDAEFPLQDYHFMFDRNIPVGYGCTERPERFTPIEWEHRIDNMRDSLYERYGDLYKDENGNLYGVETMFSGDKLAPCVWQRVEKNGESHN